MSPLAAVVLAAGKGKRMESDLPKVLHQMAGLPIVEHVLGTLEALTPERTIVVIGHQADRVRQALAARKVTFVEQTEQLGTGHAVSLTRPGLTGFSGIVLVLVGDAPLLRPGTLKAMCEQHTREQAACTVLTTRLEDPSGYGRIIRDPSGDVEAIVEHRDATPEQLRVTEINSGIIAFDSERLWEHIDRLERGNTQAEYYLTDLVEIFRAAGLRVTAWCVDDPWEVMGINSREHLAELERIYMENRLSEKEIDSR